MNFIKVLGVVFLCIASLAVLLAIVLPTVALVLGLGLEVPPRWTHYLLLVGSYPRFSLFSGLGLLIFFGWAAWHVVKG